MGEEYLRETLAYMLDRESRLPEILGKSPQLDQRRILVDWTCTSGEKLDVPKSAIHLAIVLLDRFMDGHDISGKHCLHFVCLASISIAVKFDCKETRLPKFTR